MFDTAMPARKRHRLSPHPIKPQLGELGFGPGDGARVGIAAGHARPNFGGKRFDDVVRRRAAVGEIAQIGGSFQVGGRQCRITGERSEEHTSELQSLMRISYAVFYLKNTS